MFKCEDIYKECKILLYSLVNERNGQTQNKHLIYMFI